MDTIRYYAALLLPITMPGGLLYWCSIHPFIRFCRKIGPRKTIAVSLTGTTSSVPRDLLAWQAAALGSCFLVIYEAGGAAILNVGGSMT